MASIGINYENGVVRSALIYDGIEFERVYLPCDCIFSDKFLVLWCRWRSWEELLG